MTVQNNCVSIKLCQSYFCTSDFAIRKRSHEPLHSATCSTRATRSPPPPFQPFLARKPACLPTDLRHSLASTRACPLTDRLNDATTASLLAPSEALLAGPAPPRFPLSRISKWACPLSVRLQSPSCRFTSLVLIGFSTSLVAPPPPSSPFPNFKPHSSHTGPLTAPQLPTSAAVSQISSVLLSVGFQPSHLTGTSPGCVTKTKSAALNRSFC